MKHHTGQFGGNPTTINKVILGQNCLLQHHIEVNIEYIQRISTTKYIVSKWNHRVPKYLAQEVNKSFHA